MLVNAGHASGAGLASRLANKDHSVGFHQSTFAGPTFLTVLSTMPNERVRRAVRGGDAIRTAHPIPARDRSVGHVSRYERRRLRQSAVIIESGSLVVRDRPLKVHLLSRHWLKRHGNDSAAMHNDKLHVLTKPYPIASVSLCDRPCLHVLIRIMTRCVITLVSVLAFADVMASAAETTPTTEYPSIIRSHGSEVGLSQINALLEGEDGYLWLGTFGGLVRFDGLKFTTFHAARESFSPGSANKEGPSSDRIVALREDSQGRIWIGTQDSGLSLYDRGRFRHLSFCGGTCRVYAISRQTGGDILVTTNVGLFRIATDSFLSTRIGAPAQIDFADVVVMSNGNIYAGGRRSGLGRVVGNSVAPVALPQGAGFQGVTTTGEFLWIMTTKGFYRFDPSNGSWILKPVEAGAWPVESQDGMIWVSTPSGKLLHAAPAGELERFDGLSSTHVLAVWRDRNDVLWIAGVKGLWSVQSSKALLRNNVEHILQQLGGGSSRAIVGDGRGGVWEGYTCGGIRHRLADGSYEVVRVPPAVPSECISSLLYDAQGTLWAGMLGDGLRRVAGGVRETIPTSSNYINLQIWQADNGEYWLAAERHTFKVYRDSGGTFRLSLPVAALEGLTVRKMAAARQGGVWFAGDHGLLRLDGNRVVERWTPAQGLSSRFVRAVYEDDRGVLWVGTYGGGLNRIKNGVVTRYDESNGLFDDTVSCILVDQVGQMWLGGNRGISVLPIAGQQGLKFETMPFAISSGTVSFELNGGTQSACYKDERGHLWFALTNGFAEIDPTRLVELSSNQPVVHIEQVTSRGVKYDPFGTVLLGVSDDSLSVSYTAINLVDPQQLSFRYRLGSGDSKWTEAGSTRSVAFEAVAWGDHIFEVQARNRGGSWSPSATLKISRPTPWYQRQWLWPLLALVTLLVIVWRTDNKALSAEHQQRLERISARSKRPSP